MDKIIVEGGRRLSGDVVVSGAKNAALPILASSLLVEGPCRFTNVPSLMDINSICQLLAEMGVSVSKEGGVVEIDATGLNSHEAPYDLVRKMRASILVLGPLLARLGKARVSLPGGCAIGQRPVNLHLTGLELMGAEITLEHGYIEATSKGRLKGADIYCDVPTVTGTENLMMAAALADGTTVLRNAAREPEIVALADVLRQMGVPVTGDGTSAITIEGQTSLKPVDIAIIPDRIEAGTFMVAAALTGGDINIQGAVPAHLQSVIHKLRQTGSEITESESGIRVQGGELIQSTDIKTLPFPGFPTDMQAQFMVLMSVARGQSVVMETIFENRFIHVGELDRMGADIQISSGNTAVVRGVEYLSAAPVMASDLRASASLILAGLVARGKTEVNRVYHLDRGYENIEAKFEALGAGIQRVKA